MAGRPVLDINVIGSTCEPSLYFWQAAAALLTHKNAPALPTHMQHPLHQTAPHAARDVLYDATISSFSGWESYSLHV